MKAKKKKPQTKRAKPRRASASSLRVLRETCPRGLGYYEARSTADQKVFEFGRLVHSMLERALPLYGDIAATGDMVRQKMVAASARGMEMELVMEAQELVVRWIGKHGFPSDSRAEVELSKSDYVGIVDLMWIEETESEETSYRTVVVRDYKTSWHDTTADTPQMRGYALLAEHWARRHDIEIDVVRVELANIRTLGIYSIEVDADGSKLAEWRDELAISIDGWEAADRKKAIPWAGCASCRWAGSCEVGAEYIHAVAHGASDGESVALAYAISKGAMATIEPMAKEVTKELPIHGVGYYDGTSMVPRKNAASLVCDLWGIPEDDSKARGLVALLKVTATNAKAVAKALKRPEIVDDLLDEQIRPRFKVQK